MKNLTYLSSLFLFLLLLASCGGDSNEVSPNAAIFRVDFSQTGDYEKFIKIITISGGEFKYRGTNDPTPVVIHGNNANEPSWSIEAPEVEELEISTVTTFSPVEDGPSNMSMKFTIYKNGVKVDEKTFNYNENTKDRSELLKYGAN